MIYIFTQRNDVERIFAYKTHFGASAILIKEVKNSATNDEWKIVESFLLPLHLLHLISAQVTVDTAKKNAQIERRRRRRRAKGRRRM